MAKFEDIFGNFVMVGLMVLALFSIIIIVQADNDAEQPMADDELIDSTYGDFKMRGLKLFTEVPDATEIDKLYRDTYIS